MVGGGGAAGSVTPTAADAHAVHDFRAAAAVTFTAEGAEEGGGSMLPTLLSAWSLSASLMDWNRGGEAASALESMMLVGAALGRWRSSMRHSVRTSHVIG